MGEGEKGNGALIERAFPVNFVNERTRIEVFHRKPVYNIHRWWARRPGTTFRTILLSAFLDAGISLEELKKLFYQKVDLGRKIVLDPLAGGGTTLVEASRLNCKAIGMDINPVSWFIMKKELDAVDLKSLKDAFKELQKKIAPKIRGYYSTICPECGNQADTVYVFWVRKVKCLNCGQDVKLFPSFRLTEKKKKRGRIYWTFCPSCNDVFTTTKKKATCPSCGLSFDISKGYARYGSYTCPYCGNKDRISENLSKIPEAEMFLIEYYCPTCGVKAYKSADDCDCELYEKAKKDFMRKKNNLTLPSQKIPDGKEVRRLFRYHFRYFSDFFNYRQLLCLGILLKAILKIKDENVREFLLLAFSDSLDFNNMFARYNQKASKIEPMFAHHAFYPKNMPTENNVWGTRYGRCSFDKCFKKLIRGKKYCQKPYEWKPSSRGSRKIYVYDDSVEGRITTNYKEFVAKGKKNILLKCQSSEKLESIPSKSVDAVITDPPYYDNVMYSELADFYYVWLRLGLREKFPFFEPEYCPRSKEIVVNSVQSKDEKFFLKGLTRVFTECKRVLKDNGLLVFTFHHRKEEAWTTILRAVLESGFYIVAIYPVHSEMLTSFHIHRKASMSYDTIIVCRKRIEVRYSSSWKALLDEISSYSQKTVKEFATHYRMRKEDLLVIARGKCLELYSKHYPNVKKEGKSVSVYDALQDVNSRVIPKLEEIINREQHEMIRLDRFVAS